MFNIHLLDGQELHEIGSFLSMFILPLSVKPFLKL